jgi:hypothetical protein
MIGDQTPVMKLAVGPACDTTNLLYQAIGRIPAITLKAGMAAAEQTEALRRGRLTAVLTIRPDGGPWVIVPHYSVRLEEMGSSPGTGMLETLLRDSVGGLDRRAFPKSPSVVRLTAIHIGYRDSVTCCR